MKTTEIKQLKNEVKYLINKFKISLRDMDNKQKLYSLMIFRDNLNKTISIIFNDVFKSNKEKIYP